MLARNGVMCLFKRIDADCQCCAPWEQ